MTTSVAGADWIKRLVDDERARDRVRVNEDELVARKADLVRRSGRRLLDELQVTVARDVDTFRDAFPGDAARNVEVDAALSDGGFVVRKPAPAAVSLAVTPNLETASISCHYRFALTNGLPPREERFNLMFVGEEGESLHLRHHGTGQVFLTTGVLSEFLLMPVLTGRSR